MFVGNLQIKSSEEKDQGKYECVAENSVGTEYSKPAQLYVRGKYSLNTSYKTYTLALHKEILFLLCKNQLMVEA